MKPDWTVENAYGKAGKFKKFSGQYRREYVSLFSNLERIMNLLREGRKIGGFQVGFFRSEGEGVYRIGQTGVQSAKESRLYVYPDEQTNIMYVLTVGTKDDQQNDIGDAKDTVKEIKKSTAESV